MKKPHCALSNIRHVFQVGGALGWEESIMNEQNPRIEDRASWGDMVGATIAGAICLGAVVLSLTLTDMSKRSSGLTSVPMDARSSPFIAARNPPRSVYRSTP